ncbi:hypothetical protein Smp_167350 [Schistosoma mansoni]|uniref:hypothetical protein n=1 Tax=Schistosoma mansoni TaxID=6183 RepID=UPI0001A62898|nr:hypothetical protein Smp_167350 [Schistosoma mansoni]|eukprot:XP_018645897.1 hypothetical protein Smp_167350 [Schistosoma mansoni]
MRGCHVHFPETSSPSFISLMDKMDYFSLQGEDEVGLNLTLSGWKPVESGVQQVTLIGPLVFLLNVNE